MPAIVMYASPEPIVVTGKPLPPASTGLNTIEITKQTLQQRPDARLETILTQIPDVQTFRRADSGSAHPTASGLTSRGLGGNAAGRMLVVMDGIPQNDPFGGWVAWPSLGIERIGHVRIERGGGQSRWGSGTIAGLVEIDSLTPSEGDHWEVTSEGGSRNGLLTSARASFGNQRSYVTMGGSYRRSDGFIPIVTDDRGPADIPAPYAQWEGGIRAATRIADDLEVQAGWQSFDDRRQRGLADSRNRTKGHDLSLRLVGSARHPFQLSLFRQQRRFSSEYSATDDDRKTSRLTLDQYRVPAVGLGARGDWDILRSRDLDIRIGADVRRNRGRTQEQYAFVADAPTRGRSAGGRSATMGLFADATGRGPRWQWSLAGRIDYWTLRDGFVRERAIDGPILTDNHFPDRSGWQPSGRASVRIPAGRMTFEVAIHRAWRLPTLNELYRPYRVGKDAVGANANLRPEVTDGAELSGRIGRSMGWSGGVTLFANRLHDAVANVSLGEGPGTFPGVGFVAAGGTYSQRLNVDALESVGAELTAKWRNARWTVEMSAAMVRARMRSRGPAIAIDGKRPANVPSKTLTASATWDVAPGKSLGTTVRYLSRSFEDDANVHVLHSVLTADTSANWSIAKSVDLIGTIQNLSNARVETGYSGAAIERANPRTVWLGLRVSN